MSSLIVQVCRVDQIEPHPNADKMAIATIKGWKTCIRKDEAGTQFKEGDLCVFFPPDAVLPKELSDRLGVTKYLKTLNKDATGKTPEGGRVAVSRLRGQPSYGLVSKLDILPVKMNPDFSMAWKAGDDVAGVLGITKWEPPMSCTDGDAAPPHPAFHRYFTLENYRNFLELIPVGEPVVFTEKLHGKNCRVGRVRVAGADGEVKWEWMAGSHDVRRKEFVNRKRKVRDPESGETKTEEYQDKPQFWQALDRPGVREMIDMLCADKDDVVVFGEIFGSGVQDMTYGMSNGNWEFRVFDITLNGKYLGFHEKRNWCHIHGVTMVPILYEGPFSHELVEQYVGGNTTVCSAESAGKFKGREGIVITSVKEKTVVTDKKVFDRMALKAINFEYLERAGGTEFH